MTHGVWEISIEKYLDKVTHDLKALERRMVKLEAQVRARLKEEADAAKRA